MLEVTELEIQVPWGHIAGKIWGSNKNKLALVLHGMHDNAGSFDRLMPLLPVNYHYVCIDLPGHGLSSHFPKNAPIHDMNYILALKIVVDGLVKKKKAIFIGHSWGGQLLCLFTQLYPEVVEKLVVIESVYYVPISIRYFRQFTTEFIDKSIHILQKTSESNARVQTYEKALNTIMNNRLYGSLKKEAAEAILKRCLKKIENDQYVITNDVRNRLRHSLVLNMEYVVKLFKTHNINCPVIFIFAKSSTPQKDYYKPILDQIKIDNRKCMTVELEGDHDLHNNTPEVIAPVISDFLINLSSNL